MGLKQIDEDVDATEVSHSSGGIVAASVPLLDCSARTLLRPFDVVGADVGFCRHETLTLKISHLVVKVRFEGCDQGGQRIGELDDVRVNLHVHVVSAQQRIVSLAKVKIVGVEIGADIVDVLQRGSRAGGSGQHPPLGIGSLVELAHLGVSVVSGGVVRLVHDEQPHLRKVDDPVHGVVANHLRCSHDDGRLVPQCLSFVRAGVSSVGNNPFALEVESFNRHASLLVDQPCGRGDEHDFFHAPSKVFCHRHPLNGGLTETRWHHHQAGKRKNALKGTKLVAARLHPFSKKRMNNMRHDGKVRSRVQKDDVRGSRFS